MPRLHTGLLVLTLVLAASFSSGCETSDSGTNASNDEAESSSTEAQAQPETTPANESEETTEAAPEENSELDNGDAEAKPQHVELALRDQAQPFDGVITAGQPTEEQFARLDDAGVTHVINFRTDEESGDWDEQARAEELDLEYTQIPVGSPDDLNRENVEAFDEALASSEGKTLVHCGSSNRVGAMFALRSFWIHGKGVETALEVGRRAGMGSLADAVRKKIK